VPVEGERTDFDRLSAGILAGRGVVARYPGVVCVADAEGAEPVRALVALCAAVAGFEPGRPLARRLAAWLSGPDAPPSSLRFGTLSDAGDRWAVFLSGAVSLHDAGTDTTIPGAEAAAWTDRLVTPGGPLVLLLDPLDPDPPRGRADDVFADLHDLRAGTVPGRGVVLATASAARHTAMPPLPAAAAPTPPDPDHAEQPPAPPPSPSAPSPAAAPPSPAAAAPAPPAAAAAPTPAAPPPSRAPAARPPGTPTDPAARPPLPAAAPPLPAELGRGEAPVHAEPTHGRAVPDEEPIEVTVGDGGGPPPIPPVARAEEPPVRPPRRSALIDKAPAPAQRAPLTPGRPLSPSRGPSPGGNAPRGPGAPRDRDDSPVVEGPRTRGHLCARGHLNDPRSHFCVLCGIRMNERTGELVFGARPPLGLLVFDDGATYTVDAEYLVGRMPDVDERVRNGSLRSIVVEDRSGAVSRVHAEVRVDGWDVMLVDSRSRNGTHVAGPGANTWTAVPSGRSHRLTPGTRVRLGSRTFLFESPSGVR
jgi:FHA domain